MEVRLECTAEGCRPESPVENLGKPAKAGPELEFLDPIAGSPGLAEAVPGSVCEIPVLLGEYPEPDGLIVQDQSRALELIFRGDLIGQDQRATSP